MGVRGLTTFIDRNSDLYFKTHKLRDTYIVLDGYSIGSQLYFKSKCWDCFGGDWDIYMKMITEFFDNLNMCNVTPLVIFDGAYESKKLNTVYQRSREKIRKCHSIEAVTTPVVQIPLFTFELLEDYVNELNIKVLKCYFEADKDMACLAYTLNCPVISNDSDFFIFDVCYIPFGTLDDCYQTQTVGDEVHHFIECKIYKMEMLLQGFYNMDKDNLSLLAVLMGNDYINSEIFENFFNTLKVESYHRNFNQNKVRLILSWLQARPYKKAVEDILQTVHQSEKNFVRKTINIITDGYKCEESKMLDYFQIPKNAVGDERNVQKKMKPDQEEIDKYKTVENYFPNWFLDKYKKGQLTATFINLVFDGFMVMRTVIDETQNIPSCLICIEILKAMHKILTNGERHSFHLIMRNNNATDIKKEYFKTHPRALPKLDQIESSNTQVVMLNILEISHKHALLRKVPENWVLYCLGILYWKRHSKPEVRIEHIVAVLLSAVTLNIVDKKVGHCRNPIELQKLYDKIDQNIDKPDKRGITTKCCFEMLKELLRYPRFEPDKRVILSRRKFDIKIIDTFTKLQYCLYSSKKLNSLLNFPFKNYLISDFYNGTLIYNIYVEISAMQNCREFANTIFKCAPTLQIYFDNTINAMF